MENTTEPSKNVDPLKTEESENTSASPEVIAPESTAPMVESPLSTTESAPTSADTAPSAPEVITPRVEATSLDSAPAPETPTTVTSESAAVSPATEVSESEAPTVTTPPAAITPSPEPKHSGLKIALLVIASVVVLAGVAAGSYIAGKHNTKPAATTTTKTAAMTVPAGATIIEKCEPGLGTQYILPKDIPGGPVYNVYQGKVIGIEYMTSITTVDKLDTMLENLPLYNQKYDHINVMSMPAHSGYPTPHYQVDVMMVPATTAKKITCASSNSSMPSSNSPSPNTSTDSMSGSSASKM